MNRKMQKILSFVLTLCMLLSNVPFAAFAAETAEATTTNGSYVDGKWTEEGTGSITYPMDGTNVTLSKTATPVAGQDNVFDITLRVETSTTTTTNSYYNAGAVVLVIDVSGSMAYCADCGNASRHEVDCPKNTSSSSYRGSEVTDNDSRMVAAQGAAASFLANYAGDDPNATRMLAIVAFESSVRSRLDWINVAGGAGKNGYDTALQAIYRLYANGGTNLDDGLYHARTLLNQSDVANIESKSVIALTDGAPTRSRSAGDGTEGSATINAHTAAQAENVRGIGATLYTVCFGVANDYTYENRNGTGPTVGEFLSGSVASNGCAYNADNSSELYAAFAKITESITSGLTGSDWTATDPMADMISVSSASGNFTTSDNDTYTWTLGEPTETIVDGDTTTYVYTVTYRVTLDVQGQNFVEGAFFPTNDPTYLNLVDGTQLAFPVPGVKGVLPRTDVSVTKVWDDNDNQDGIRPTSVTVQLMKDGQVYGDPVVLSADNSWTYTWTDLIQASQNHTHVYTVVETSKHTDYAPTYPDSGNAYNLIVKNVHQVYKKDITVTKTWEDKDDQDGIRPGSITVNLLADGEVKATAELTAASGWSYTFSGFDVYKAGKEIVYTVTEDAVPGYTTTINGLTITNTHEVEKTEVKVTKVWEDANNQDGIRPTSVTFSLLANGVDTGKTITLTGNTGWTGTIADLDKYSNGKLIKYTVSEIAVEGYTTSYSDDGLTVTNTHVPAVTEVKGSKTWNDNNNQDGVRPENITINLVKNGEIIATKTVTADDGWAWTFSDLPKFENGEDINYSIVENAVEDYSTSYNGHNVINTHTPAQISVSVTKSWQDNNDQDGIRANDITVTLLANGVDTGKTLVLNEGNNWTGSFTELNKFVSGTEIIYSVAEVSVEGYTTAISGDQATGYTITNTHETETVDVSGKKTWVDNDNQDGIRPTSITIHLLKNGEIIDTKTVTEADGWAWSFNNLPKYENQGTLINYSVTENAVEDYTTSYNGYDVINTHAPEKTSVTVTKAWADSDDQDGIRPDEVIVSLLANDEDTGITLVLSGGNNWTDTFTDLDKYANGEEIVYTVAEKEVTGYEADITGTQADGYTITNIHAPATVSFFGEKIWKDHNNQDGKRPESITINLVANGEVIKSIVVTEEDNWQWMFEDLPEFENHGNKIIYAITENAVEEYTTEYDGFDVINTHDPEKVSVTVTKAWEDKNDQDGIRPEKITVILVANGKETREKLVLSEDNGWTGSFSNLDKYAKGEEIEYTVTEVTVEGYETVITGDMTVGYTITNSHNTEVIEVAGSKTWDDADNQDGKRPESITVNLMKDGKVIATKTVSEADNWSWTFDNLPKYENHGVEIVYTVTEVAVEGYTTTYDGYNITNSYTPAEVSLTVTKAWADSNDEDGIRPRKVTILLFADGKLTDETLVLTADGNWSGSFVGLPKYANGVEIVYTIGEVAVEGYNAVIRGDMVNGFVVTNSHTVIPQTGDERTPMMWIFLMLASAAAAAYVGFDSKKRRNIK